MGPLLDFSLEEAQEGRKIVQCNVYFFAYHLISFIGVLAQVKMLLSLSVVVEWPKC